MIRIEDIVRHIDGFVRPLDGSQQILESGYLQNVGISDEQIDLRAVCLRASNAHEVLLIKVAISKPFPGRVLEGKCSCVAGNSAKCKHLVTVLRYVMT